MKPNFQLSEENNMSKKIISALLVLTVLLCTLTACTGTKTYEPADSIAQIGEEIVMLLNSDMTRTELYKTFGETAGQKIEGTNGFLATYIVNDNYIFSISIHDDNDTAIGYDGEALMNSLKASRTLKTTYGMTVSAEENFNVESGEDGLEVTVQFDGDYTCSMPGYDVYVGGKAVGENKKLSGKKVLTVDLLNPHKAEDATEATTAEAAESTTTEAEAEDKKDETKKDATDATTVTVEMPEAKGNYLVGMLEIANEADETVYVEIYSINDENYICRVRL